MKKTKKGFAIGLNILVMSALFGTFAPLAFALPTTTSFGVEDAVGYKDTHVLIPVNITNVQNGPVPSIIFNILYNNSVINVVDVQKGALISDWEDPSYFNHDCGTKVAIVYDAIDEHAIPNGSTGSIVLLNFSVIGELGDTSRMNFTNIQVAEGHPYYQIGTAPAKNGTFSALLHVKPEMHVGDIITSSKYISRGPWTWYKAIATTPILDSLDKPVDGATVEGHWSGAYNGDVSGSTGSDGKVTFETSWVKDGGTFTFTVDNVTKEGWTYNSSANVKTYDSIKVP